MAYITPKFITGNLLKKQVVRVEKLIGERIKFKNVVLKKQFVLKEKIRRNETEKKIEDKPDSKEKEVSGKIQVPKLGILDAVKNFIFKLLLGAFAIKLLPHLPKLKGVLIGVMKLSEFVLQFAGSLLNSLVTFVDKVYQIVDFGKQQAKLLGGDKGLQKYNKMLDIAKNVMNAMFIAGMLFSDLVEMDAKSSVTQQAVESVRDTIVEQGVRRAAQQAAVRGASQVGVRAATGAVFGVGLISSALGEGAFQLRKFTLKIQKDVTEAYNEAQSDKNPFMRFIKTNFYSIFVRPGLMFVNFLLGGLGTLLDVVGAPFRYAIELINYGIMMLTGDSEGIKRQRENLGKFDARIREQIREIVNTLSFGTIAKEKGSFGSLFGTDATKAMGYAEGGPITRGGVYTESVGRTIGEVAKARRVVSIPTAPLQPGADVSGRSPYEKENTSKIETFYPDPSNKSLVNPYEYLEKSYSISKTTKFLHPLLEISIKTLFGDKPPESDFKSVGVGLDNFLNNILDTTKVPGKDTSLSTESGSVDISKWASGMAKDSMMSSIKSILSDLSYQLTLKKNNPYSEKESSSTQGSSSSQENPLAEFGGEAQFVIGDSIAHGFAGRSGKGNDSDDSQVGRSPANVLKILQARGDALKGMLIDLSTGIANSPGDIDSIEKQLSYLKSIGAKVRVLGVANSFSEKNGGLNQKLEQLVKKYGFYFYGGYAGKPGDVHGTPTDYAELKEKARRDTSQIEDSNVNFGEGKDKKMYLHWTAGDYQSVPRGAYHAIVTGDGKIHRVIPYNQIGQHTSRRNTNSVGLSVAAMGGSPDPWSIPVKGIQYEKMAEEASKIAKAWGWKANDINIKNVMTHAEAGSNKDGIKATDNYGPRAWGGTGERWDLFQLYKNAPPGSGGNAIRNMIKGKMFEGGYIKETGMYLTHPGEYVIDADSVMLFGINFYDIINQTESIGQRKKASENLISILSQYTEDGFPETEEDYTYYAPESSTITVIPPETITIPGQSFISGGGYDPSQDSLYM